jgi:hypothetical protein
VRRLAQLHLTGLCFAFVATGCVDGFRGSNLQLDLSSNMLVQASPGMTPMLGQIPSASHFSVYGVQTLGDHDALFALNTFEVHPIVDVNSPCFLDEGQAARFPGLHSSMYADKIAEVTGIKDYRNPPAGASENDKIDAATAAQRMLNIAALGAPTGIKAVTTASESGYPPVAADCNGSDTQIPPPKCIDDASNARRLKLCQQAWAADKNLWEGTDRVLTAPLAGTTYGLVDGTNPINQAPIGGASFFLDEAVSTMDAFAIYYRTDNGADPGTLLFYGTPTKPTRGVTRAHMTSITNPNLTAELAVFADLGEDDVHF